MQIIPQIVVKGIDGAIRNINAEHKRHEKAMQTAVKVRGFKLMQLLRKELRAGAPGGHKLAPLSIMRRTMRANKRGTLGADKPLASLAKSVGYITNYGSPGFRVTVGFGHAKIIKLASATWRRIAKKQQEGFTTSVTDTYFRNQNITIEQYLRQEGSRIDKALYGGKKSRRRNVFFLRKSTRSLRTPPRSIIDPFIAAHRAESLLKIRRDYIRKLRGERI